MIHNNRTQLRPTPRRCSVPSVSPAPPSVQPSSQDVSHSSQRSLRGWRFLCWHWSAPADPFHFIRSGFNVDMPSRSHFRTHQRAFERHVRPSPGSCLRAYSSSACRRFYRSIYSVQTEEDLEGEQGGCQEEGWIRSKHRIARPELRLHQRSWLPRHHEEVCCNLRRGDVPVHHPPKHPQEG